MTVLIFAIVFILIIGYARGYRLDINNTQLSSNGLVAVTSSPRSAKIYVNNVFKGVTDTSLYLEPGTYDVDIVKDGYFPWSKTIKIQGEVVQSVDATLYPINASLNPLTNIGVLRAIPFGIDGKKVLIFSSILPRETTEIVVDTPPATDQPSEPKTGIFVYDPRSQAVSIFPALMHIVDYKALGTDINPEQYEVLFAPNFDQAILFYNSARASESTKLSSEFESNYIVPADFEIAYLISLNELNNTPLDITNSALSLVEAWSMQKSSNLSALLSGYHRKIQTFIQSNTKIIDVSPDKTRILYEATAGAKLDQVLKQPLIGVNQTEDVRTILPDSIYVYDVREDRNYLVIPATELSRQHAYPLFHPNSKNIVLNEENSINIMDYDGKNKQKLYSGPYDSNFFAVTSDGRVLVLTKFNTAANKSYDLYAVGIR